MNETPSQPPVAVIIVAAGRGERLGGETPKVWRSLGGRTLIERAWRSFCPDHLAAAGQRIHPGWIGLAVEESRLAQTQQSIARCPVPLIAVPGGPSRRESVRNVLMRIPESFALIAIHDAARPFWPVHLWDNLLTEASKGAGAILAVSVSDTLKRAGTDRLVTVDRSGLWAAQTPQVFHSDWLRRAHDRAQIEGWNATDDADLVDRVGGVIKNVSSTPRNFKITTREDWEMAASLVEHSSSQWLRTGHGYDSHRLGGPGPFVLGGVRLADTGGLIGHSDGDVLLHAVCDALLGAAALGDIGRHFPPDDPCYEGCDSRELLRSTRAILADRGYVPVQVDATVIAEAPRLAPHISAMRGHIAADLGLAIDAVSVKATTNEGMGFVGRREGIAVHAVATVQRTSGELS